MDKTKKKKFNLQNLSDISVNKTFFLAFINETGFSGKHWFYSMTLLKKVKYIYYTYNTYIYNTYIYNLYIFFF